MNITLSYRTRPTAPFKSLPLDFDAMRDTTAAPPHPRSNPEGTLTYGDLALKDFVGTIQDSAAVTIWCNSAEDLEQANALADDVKGICKFEYSSSDELEQQASRRGGAPRLVTRITLSHTKPSGISTDDFGFLRSVLKAAIAPKQ